MPMIYTIILYTILALSAGVSLVAHVRLGIDIARWLARRADR